MPAPTRRRTAKVLAASAAAALLVALAPAAPAAAHNQLLSAVPAKNATVTKAPKAIDLVFLEEPDAGFTTVLLTDAAQQQTPLGPPTVRGTKATVAVTGQLANGVYQVAYRVVSIDGHPVQGSFRFTVADPAAPPPVAVTPSPAAPTADAGLAASASGWPTWSLVGGGAAVTALIVGTLFLTRRRSGR
ncbi:copper resistance CopC family protein [Pilimelia columellifera]|uniref:CopC domain-containing protein n=1 Tax=Pilimelia columellifera subsp. columellifera TaxID=706583 RepID=A0ABN3NPF9_9ACTN